MKNSSCFFGKDITDSIRRNIEINKAAESLAARYIAETDYWINLSYEELEHLVFSPEIPRSWFVLSDGNCPVCKKDVPMYNWISAPKNTPWKMICPHCNSKFPSNDFGTYYESGLDAAGRFSYERADSSLLVPSGGNSVIDDGRGWYDEYGRRYMFIGAYLCHAQWIKLIVDGVTRLAFSYVLTGNAEYSRRAAVILNAVSRFWPEFDFFTQGIMYEQANKSQGYVNYWANSNREIRLFAFAYDQIFEALEYDCELPRITGKSIEDTKRNIEDRILRDSLNNMDKINTNPPETPLTVAIVRSVLDFEEKKDDIFEHIDELIKEATLVDGLSGESGLGGYAAITPRALADLLCIFSNTDISFLKNTLEKHPVLYKTYRFHIDTWYEANYYPGVGDSSVFAMPYEQYTALFSRFAPSSSIFHRSREWFAIKLTECFNDPDFAKTIYFSHGNSIKGCFDHDLYIENTSEYENVLRDILENTGYGFRQESINYSQWKISILHMDRTMLAIPYSSGANHCHHDALSLHLFHKGMNLTADFGYPPVNHGGWNTKEALWYKQPSAHNTVVVDKEMHTNLPPEGDGMFYRYPQYGSNILFFDGSFAKAAYNDAHEYADVERFERICAVISGPGSDSYCVDVFRVKGGESHARFQRSTYSELSHSGLEPISGTPYDTEKTIMRNFMTDSQPDDNWHVDFTVEDPNGVLDEPQDLHLRYISLNDDVTVTLCESWVDITNMAQVDNKKTENMEIWIPTVIEEKTGGISQFTGILEMYEGNPFIKSSKLIESPGDFTAIIEVQLDQTTDVIMVNDPKKPTTLLYDKSNISTDALLAIVRLESGGNVKACICGGNYISVRGKEITPGDNNMNFEFM